MNRILNALRRFFDCSQPKVRIDTPYFPPPPDSSWYTMHE